LKELRALHSRRQRATLRSGRDDTRMIFVVLLFGHLKRRIFAPRMLRFRGCPVQGRRACFALLWVLPATAMAVVKPEQQAQEEERRHEHEKDQHGFQKTIHSKTPFLRAARQPRAHATHRPISPPPGPIRKDETARLTSSPSVSRGCYGSDSFMTI